NVGGTQLHIEDLISKIENETFYILYKKKNKLILDEYRDSKLINTYNYYCGDLSSVVEYTNPLFKLIYSAILVNFKIDLIHIHHLKNHTFDIIYEAKSLNLPIIITIHDYYLVCPKINLIDRNNCCCVNRETKELCGECMSEEIGMSFEELHLYREEVSKILLMCNEVIIPNKSVSEVLLIHYYCIKEKIRVIEHGQTGEVSKYAPTYKNGKFNVAFVGGLKPCKGSKEIIKIIKNCTDKDINFFVFGTIDDKDFDDIPSHNINCTGNYFRKDIYKLLEENEIHIVCILSIWPETFCYTLSESWQCNIPVITVDIGATGERVKNGGGILITGNNIGESTLKSIIELKNDRNKYESLCKTVKNIKLRDIGEMSKDYSNLYFSYMKNVMLDNKISSELILDALKNIDLFQTNNSIKNYELEDLKNEIKYIKGTFAYRVWQKYKDMKIPFKSNISSFFKRKVSLEKDISKNKNIIKRKSEQLNIISNIEYEQVYYENEKLNFYVEGWFFSKYYDMNVSCENCESFSIERLSRPDVQSHFGGKKEAENSGYRIAFIGVEENSKISLVFDIGNLKKYYNFNVDTSQGVVYIGKYPKKLRWKSIPQLFDMTVVEPYKYKKVIDKNSETIENVSLILNATRPIKKEWAEETIRSIINQGFKSLYIISCNENLNLFSEIDNIMLVSSKLLTRKEECLEFLTSKYDFNCEYVSFISIGDKMEVNTIREMIKEAKKSNSFIVTTNENRFFEEEYFAPFYKQQLYNRFDNPSIDRLCRKSMLISTDKIIDFISGNIKSNEIKIIDKILYNYRLYNDNIDNKVKVLAYYLPQFHTIPENDEWWGEGFTEWVNVNRGRPMFKGHYQPHVPGELGYYNLVKDEGIQKKQSQLANDYNIYGMCYYYYWFNGKKLLEKPLENLIADKSINTNFCICWANENWCRRWDGLENEILIKQEHNVQSDKRFIYDVLPILKDERYITIDNKPILLVYKSDLFPNFISTVESWNKICIENGLEGLEVITVQTGGLEDPRNMGCKYAVEFPPHNIYSRVLSAKSKVEELDKDFEGTILDYSEVAGIGMNKKAQPYTFFRGVMLSWDNTARRNTQSRIFYGSNPNEYKKWIASVIDFSINFYEEKERMIFINAWNEWAEGTHLEPDEKYGHKYLEVTKEVLGAQY
ncbi:glycoside hydrolase family 99-like domain-containing protein, partial [Clostridioides difficile]